MTKYQKFALVLLRLSMGALFFYAGVSKIIDPTWSAAGYINNAANFKSVFTLLTAENVLPIINLINEWGLALLGVSLLLGALVSFSAPLGALLMLLYYVVLPFPMPNAHALVVDEHIVYIFALLALAAFEAGTYAGIDALLFGRSKSSNSSSSYRPQPGGYRPYPDRAPSPKV